MRSIFSVITGIVQLRGNTDNTLIGNVSDALKVTGTVVTGGFSDFGSLKTYSASFSGTVPAAATTDLLTIQGSASKTIKVFAVGFSCTTTSGSGFTSSLTIVKRSSVNTGGTSSTLTNVPLDSANAAATAVVKSYTANPSALGTSLGAVDARRYSIFTVNNNGIPSVLDAFSYGMLATEPLVLRGTSEFACLNLGGITITSPVASGFVKWVEV